MSGDGERRKSGFFAFVDLGLGFLELGWRSLEFLLKVADRLLPAKQLPEPLPKSGRAPEDAMECKSEMRRREHLGTGLVVCFFLIAVLGGIGFLIAYWSGGNNTQLLGGSLAVFLGAMGHHPGALGALAHES